MAKDKMDVGYGVKYPCTNESIPAVLGGLGLKSDDVVVSIAGSGDIPFAISPYVSKVYAVDSDESQIEFMREQVEFLEEGDFDGFCRSKFMARNGMKYVGNVLPLCDVGMDHMIARRDYFEQKFSETRGSLSRIEIVNEDILGFMGSLDKNSVNRVYFSNIFDWVNIIGVVNDNAIDAISVGGIIYDSSKCDGSLVDTCSSGKLSIKKDNTTEARVIQGRMNNHFYNWTPSVYSRVM